jgi:hypothetical protein
VRAGIAAVLVISAVVWGYAFLLADPTPTDKLRSGAFPKAAVPVCNAAKDAISNASLIGVKADTPQQRGDITEKADTILRTMVDDLKPLTPADGEDARMVSAWLADWDGFLGDRAAWVIKLKSGDGSAFLEHSHEGGEPASKTMDAFAAANDMKDCKGPDNY